jgi:hypothetical protein
MKTKLMNEKEFAYIIAELLIDPEDPSNQHPEHNAYNWGLIDAQRALQGVSIDVIKEHRPK